MIYLILKTYQSYLIVIVLGALLLFIFGLIRIIKKIFSTKDMRMIRFKVENKKIPDASLFIEEEPDIIDPNALDIQSIAGEDIVSTQLDLARAYIETGSHESAKKILEEVAIAGNDAQQNEARILLGSI